MSDTSRTLRPLLAVLGVLGLIAALVVTTAGPASSQMTFTVTANRITGTAADDDPTPDGCAAHDCSLREAVRAANTTAGADTVEFASSGTVALGETGPENSDAVANDLDVLEDVTITAPSGGLTVDASGLGGGLDGRHFDVDPTVIGSIQLTIEGLTLTDGFSDGSGGSIQLGNDDTVDLQGATLQANGAGSTGGAIGSQSGGTIDAEDTTFSDNVAGFSGGAIGLLEGQGISINSSTLQRNTAGVEAGGDGGAVFFNGIQADSTLDITLSTLRRNVAIAGDTGEGRGGAVAVDFGTLSIVDSVIRANGFGPEGATLTDMGGGVATTDSLTTEVQIVNTTIRANRVIASGGGASLGTEQGQILIDHSAIIGNDAGSTAGGVEFLTGNPITIAHTTVSQNTAPELGTAIVVPPATTTPPTVTLQHATVHSNGEANLPLGAVYTVQGGETELHNTLLADNSGDNCVGGGTYTSLGYNLEDIDTCSLTATGDLPNTAPGTDALASNGGRAQGDDGANTSVTHALQAGSNALDVADPATCGTDTADSDQRYVTRPQGPECDIGAFERQMEEDEEEQADLDLIKSLSRATISPGDSSTYQLDVTNDGPDQATNTEVTDTIPSGLTIDGVSTSTGSCTTAGQNVTCDLGDLAVGDSATVEIDVTAPSTGTYTNDGETTSETPDPDLTNNEDQVTLRVTDDGDGDGFDDGNNRCEGATRIETAINCSERVFDEADAVVLTRSDKFPDAQTGTPLAIQEDAPMLLSQPEELNEATEDQIELLLDEGDDVYLLGGTAALSQAVEDRLDDLGYNTIRYGGINRFETAAIIADQGLGNPDDLLAANGGGFPDSVVAGAASVAVGSSDAVEAAVILTSGSNQSPQTQAYLDSRTDDPTITAIGGDACEVFPDVTCLQGPTRFETALAVANQFFTNPDVVGVATGLDFADALIGGAIVGRPDIGPGPMVLVEPDDLPTTVEDYLEDNSASIDRSVIFGGTAAISTDVENDIATALGF